MSINEPGKGQTPLVVVGTDRNGLERAEKHVWHPESRDGRSGAVLLSTWTHECV